MIEYHRESTYVEIGFTDDHSLFRLSPLSRVRASSVQSAALGGGLPFAPKRFYHYHPMVDLGVFHVRKPHHRVTIPFFTADVLRRFRYVPRAVTAPNDKTEQMD